MAGFEEEVELEAKLVAAGFKGEKSAVVFDLRRTLGPFERAVLRLDNEVEGKGGMRGPRC